MKEGKNFSLPWLALSRPVSVTMVFIACLVVGVIAYVKIPLQLLPSGFSPPFLYVTIPTIPSTPADVERDIVRPVEGLLRTVRNVEKIRARARANSAGFFIGFRDGSNMDVAYNQVRDRLQRARSELPPEAQRSMIWKFSPDDDPMVFLGIRIKAPIELRSRILDDIVVRPIETLSEVSRVEVQGGDDLKVIVDVDDKRANAAGVPISEIIKILRDDNFSISGGELDNGEQRFPIRVLSNISGVEAIENLPIPNGLHLKDVASVRVSHQRTNQIYHIDSEEGAIITVFREPNQNAVDASEKVKTLIKKIAKENPHVSVSILFDQGEVIENSIQNLTETALWGGFFAILILFVFLRRFRVMLVTASAIPLSMLLTLVVMYLSGTTLNALSLMGLMLSVGMVVDNSIVVTEAIQRRRGMGEKASLAAPAGASEVGLAIVVATSTTIIVFLPMVLMSGSETLGFFLGKIGYPVCLALVASLIVSLVFIPLALTKFDAGVEPQKIKSIEAIQDGYARLLAWCLSHRTSTFLLIILSMFTLIIPAKGMKETDKADANINDARLFFSFEPTTTFEEKRDGVKLYETWLQSRKEELEIKTSTTRIGGLWGNPEIRLFFRDASTRETTREEIIEKLRESLPQKAGIRWRLGWGGSEQNVSLRIEGRDSRKLSSIAQRLALELQKIDDVFSVLVGANGESAIEMHYSIDRDAAAKSGISPLMVGGAIDYALRGRRLGTIQYRGEKAALWIRNGVRGKEKMEGNAERTLSKKELEDIAIPSVLGGPGIGLGTATKTNIVNGFSEISRTNGQTQTRIQLMTTQEDLKALGKEIDFVLARFEMPEGYRVVKGQRFQDLADEKNDRAFALTLAVVFVFLLMGILFESFILPFVIVLSIPFAFLGVYWTLYLTGTPFDVMAGVGLIILVGIVVNNAIVLVDRINLNLSDQSRNDALIEAGRARLRPIVMTALTTIGGLIPMAIGGSQIIGIPYAPLGRTVIGGLLASTLFTLIVVPLFYTILDDLRNYWRASLG